ncbi:alpha/beta hydrolase [Paraglaciecola polaris]|uniref:alpha/beta hydrolase n=1 Tax=Paraglaciecola polaris TaxID=222814 RepID=UPI0030EC5DCA
MHSFTVNTSDEGVLYCREWLPEGVVKAVIHIAHGMSEHGGRYQRFALALNHAGYAVVANDHRGHGLSVTEGQALGHMADDDGWQKALSDLALVNQHIQRRHPNLAVILFGHSMGSFLSQDYLAHHGGSIAGVALSSTNGPAGLLLKIGRLITKFERYRIGAKGHSPLILTMVFGAYNKAFAPNRTEFDWLSRDDKEVDQYLADPLCGFQCSVQTWLTMLAALGQIANDDAIENMDKTKPIYVFSGTEDPVGENTTGVKRLLAAYKKHGFSAVTSKFYLGGRHEMLNETNRGEVTADFIDWADGVLVKNVQSKLATLGFAH